MKDFTLARRFFLKLLGAAGVVAASTETTGCAPVEEEEGDASSGALAESFEYIVIGSGAGGGPLAANLARAGHSVLLLEAGEDKGARLNYQVPAWHAQSTEDETMRWDYWVKHYERPEELDSKDGSNHGERRGTILYPRAGTLGGCTSHNAMITVYPHERDWDGIADLTGDESWSGASMRRYFEILERCEYLRPDDDSRGHGKRGWLGVNKPDARLALGDLQILTQVKAAARGFARSQGKTFFERLGLDVQQLLGLMRRDLNAATPGRDDAEGVYTIPLAITNGKRNGPREYLLDTVAKRHPLTIRTGAYVTKILFHDEPTRDGKRRVKGVEYRSGKHLYRADPKSVPNPAAAKRVEVIATREVIVSAGAFNTPQLLKLSGVGPRAELDALGIDVVVDLPGVGENLQDRYEVGVVSEVRADFATVEACTFGAGASAACLDAGDCSPRDLAADPCLAQWKSGAGPYATNGTVVGIVKRSRPDLREPDLFVFGGPAYFKGYEPGYAARAVAKKNQFTWAVLKAHTGNTAGSVRLRSKNWWETPDISFRYFHEGTSSAADADLDAMVAGVELARTIGEEARALSLAPVLGKFDEIVPGPAVKTREDVKRFVKREAWGHHASCTCPIGADGDPKAVLDAKLQVRGTSGLRVVDASVFPKIPGFFIVVPIYMVSEKATDMILESLGERRRA